MHPSQPPQHRVRRHDTLEAYTGGVERAIKFMSEHLGELLSIDDLADAAHMSRFHFTRVFAQITSASPGRFLAAVRIQEAKRLLLRTNRNVTEVALEVGYNSLGTFTRIFADFVGFPPIRFRQLSRPLLNLSIEEVMQLLPVNPPLSADNMIYGTIDCESPLALVAVGLFPTTIPRSHPMQCLCATNSLQFCVKRTSARAAYIFGAGLLPNSTLEDALLVSTDKVRVGVYHLPAETAPVISLELKKHRVIEPPIVVAFPLHIAESLMTNRMSTLGEAALRPA